MKFLKSRKDTLIRSRASYRRGSQHRKERPLCCRSFATPFSSHFRWSCWWYWASFGLAGQSEPRSAESILASIETQDLVAYLSTTDFTTDELLDQVSLDVQDANQIEEEVYGLDLNSDEDVEEILDQIDINSL